MRGEEPQWHKGRHFKFTLVPADAPSVGMECSIGLSRGPKPSQKLQINRGMDVPAALIVAKTLITCSFRKVSKPAKDTRSSEFKEREDAPNGLGQRRAELLPEVPQQRSCVADCVLHVSALECLWARHMQGMGCRSRSGGEKTSTLSL
jgi:hypothetical protein